MAEGKTRVDFNAPESLVEEADAVAELLDHSRTSLLVDALRGHLDDIVTDETFRRRLTEAYYTDRVAFETVETILGREEAMRIKRLRESLSRAPPVPDAEAVESVIAAEFYEGDVPEWTPDDDEADDIAATDP